jgi:hypothetical protein
MNDYKNPYNEPPPRGSSNAWVWILLIALFVPMFLCAGLCGGLFLLRVKTVEVAEQRAQRAESDAIRAVAEQAARSGPAYQQMAMERIQADLDVKAKLGQPIRQTGRSSFRSQTSADESTAELDYEVRGPRGKATVHGEAVEIDGRWWFEKLDVTCSDGETIDLADVEIPIRLD